MELSASHVCSSTFSNITTGQQFLKMFALSSTISSSISPLTNVTQKVLETSAGVVNDARYLFYLVSPYEAMYHTLQSTPRYITKVILSNKSHLSFFTNKKILKSDVSCHCCAGAHRECHSFAKRQGFLPHQ